ncbi:cytochrome P450 [Mycena capillaripes]|nr:cytochrome P450 [Mycena capillaripes]
MFITLTQLLLWAISLRLLSSLARSIHGAFFSPLSRIPGPWYMSMSDFWLSTHLMRFKQTSTIHELFQVYGPVVRVGPNKVAFCDLAGMRDVYLDHKFPKNSAFYDNFRILTFFENKSHAARRRAVGPHYTANVPSLQPEMHKVTLQLLESLETIAGRQPVDCLHLLRSYMVDIVVFSSFGYELGAVKKWTANKPDYISDAITDFPKASILSSFFPPFLWNAFSQIPNARWKRFTRATQILKQLVARRIREAQELHGEKESNVATLVERLLQHKDSTTQERLSINSVVAETVAHLQASIAGSETSSTTLSYLLWELCSFDISQKLRAEIDTAMPDPRVIPDSVHLQELPYLNAFIQEGLRIHGAVPPLLERVVPPGSDFQLMQYTLPPGTVVGTQAWSVHRVPDVFPSPDIFNPERWLNDEANVPIRAAHTMPFGLGTRTCSGQPLAQAALRIAVAALVRNFTITSHASTTKASMAMRHGFVNFPAGGECKLILTPRTD